MNRGYAGISLESPDVGIGLNAGWKGGLPPIELGNVLLGPYAGRSITMGTAVTAPGSTGGYNVYLGYSAATSATIGDTSVAIGAFVGPIAGSAGRDVFIGYQAGSSDASSGGSNVYVGFQAGKFANSNGNVVIGYQAVGTGIMTGQSNTVIGVQAGQNLAGGNQNVFIGTSAGQTTSSATNSIVIGYAAGANQNFANCVFIGYHAGSSTSGASNVCLGYSAGGSLSSGANNTFVGFQAGTGAGSFNTTTASGQTLVGYNTGQASSTAQYSYITCLGYGTTVGAAGGVAIGADHTGASATTSTQDQIQLGTSLHNVNVPGTFSVTGGATFGMSASGVGSQIGVTATAYAALTTSATVTVTTGTKALAFVTAEVANGTANDGIWVSLAVSGATTIAASDTWALLYQASVTGGDVLQATVVIPFIASGAGALTAGANVFTVEARVNGGSGNVSNATVTVIPIG